MTTNGSSADDMDGADGVEIINGAGPRLLAGGLTSSTDTGRGMPPGLARILIHFWHQSSRACMRK